MSDISRNSRIIFVDPNASPYEQQFSDNKTRFLTPPYEEFCISFNLIIENYPRYRTSFESSRNGTMAYNQPQTGKNTSVLSWFYQNSDKSQSVMSGNNFGIDGGPRYLTTYYTDISYDNYGQQDLSSSSQIVEGLGVKQVQVNFESWYTPTVTINFVDVRGSGLMGNEEAVHTNGKLTAETVFGKLMQFPFPKIYLQIKGFLGSPVTYQLTISGMNSEYNSQTGDFEITVNFIGYNYSLLTDIPFEYLIAAPYDTFYGKDYWDKHQNSKEWQMDDGTPPPRLFQLLNDIKTARPKENADNVIISDDDQAELNSINNETALLNTLLSSIVRFINEVINNNSGLKGSFCNIDEETKNKQYVLFYDGDATESTTTAFLGGQKEFTEMQDALECYNTSFTGKALSEGLLPNKFKSCPSGVTASKLLKVTRDDNNSVTKVEVVTLGNKAVNVTNIMNISFGDDRKLIKKNAEEIYKYTTMNNPPSNVYDFVYILDTYDLEDTITQRIDSLNERAKVIKKKAELNYDRNIKNYVKFVPWIGNVFKVIMCHLETLVHIMFQAGQEIISQSSDGKRTISALGANGKLADVIDNGKGVPPWPKVKNQGNTIDNTTGNSENNTIAWIGDISHKFIEEDVVLGLMDAVNKIYTQTQIADAAKVFASFPLLPQDFNKFSSPFIEAASSTGPSNMAGYLSFRASQLLGMMHNNTISDNMAELLGIMDAYNYYIGGQGASSIANDFLGRMGNGDKIETLIGIASCRDEYDCYGYTNDANETRHYFETVLQSAFGEKYRHPMVKSINNGYLYCHYYTNNFISLLPSELKNYSNYSLHFKYEGGNDKTKCHFVPQFERNSSNYSVANGWLHKSDSTKVTGALGRDSKQYINRSLFNVIDNDDIINSIEDKYEKIKSQSVVVGDVNVTEDFSSVVKTFWKIEGSDFVKFFNTDRNLLSKKRSVLGIPEDKLMSLPETGYFMVQNVDFWYDLYGKYFTGDENIVKITDNGEYEYTVKDEGKTVSLDELCIAFFPIYDNGDLGCLFGSPFYYMQNNNKSGVKGKERSRNAKALLFLHSLIYDYSKVLNVFSKAKTHGGIECVPYGYLLMLGGLLWRYRYMTDNEDPIIYDEGTYHYKKPGRDYSLLMKNNSNHDYCPFVAVRSGSTENYDVPLSSFFGGGNDWLPDANIQNQLISFFLTFSSDTFSKIMSAYEAVNVVDEEGNSKEYTCDSFSKDVKKFYDTCNTYDFEGKYAIAPQKVFDTGFFRTRSYGGWVGKVRTIVPGDTCLKILFEENESSQVLFKKLYTKKLLVVDGCYRRMHNSTSAVGDDDQITIRTSSYRSYLKGFLNKLEELAEKYSTSNVKEVLTNDEEWQDKKDIAINIYYYLKTLWDNWLLAAESMNQFDVNVFFRNNFVFIDSFYRNTYKLLPINCEKLYQAMTKGDRSRSLFSVLNDIISDHHCIFFAEPDYIAFDGGFTQDGDIETMKNLFRPLPYNKMSLQPNLSNKFVIIYTHKPSEIKNGDVDYASDGFDIWSTSSGELVEHSIFSTSQINADDNDPVTRMGYNVPSFGVVANTQNNHIFKNIKVNMNNPTVTDQSIRAYSNILKMSSDNAATVVFHGQDLYQIYSSYSYECEVEMIGNAQICPLMYFQLCNMPLWRGTYMIFNVTHVMKPGDMTTRFKGMKLSRYPMPFGTSFFSIKKGGENGGYSTSYRGYNMTFDNVTMDSTYDMYEPTREYFDDVEGGYRLPSLRNSVGKVTVNQAVRTLFNRLVETIKMLPENRDRETWNICLSSVVRPYVEHKDTGDHTKGYAMDVNLVRFDANHTPTYCNSETNRPELMKVVDILYSLFRNDIRQVLVEYFQKSDMNPSTINHYNALHISVKYDNKNEFAIMAPDVGSKTGSNGYGHINRECNDNGKWFLENVTPAFDYIAAKAYAENDYTTFKKLFTNYGMGGITQDILKKHFDIKTSGMLFEKAFRMKNPKVDWNTVKDEIIRVSNSVGIDSNIIMVSAMYETGCSFALSGSNSMSNSYKTGYRSALCFNGEAILDITTRATEGNVFDYKQEWTQWKQNHNIVEATSESDWSWACWNNCFGSELLADDWVSRNITTQQVINQIQFFGFAFKHWINLRPQLRTTYKRDLKAWNSMKVSIGSFDSYENSGVEKNICNNRNLTDGLKKVREIMTDDDIEILKSYNIYL